MNELDEVAPIDDNGRPCFYIRRGAEQLCKQAQNLAQLGLDDTRLAFGLGISRMTLHRYREWFPEFADAIVMGRETRLAEVVDKLYERALGYSCPEVKVLSTKDGIHCEQITKHYPPDVRAIEMLLTNRLPKYWKSASRIELVNGNVPEDEQGPEVDYENLSQEELDQFEQLLKKATRRDEKRIGNTSQDSE